MSYPIKPSGNDILPFDTIFAENNSSKTAMTSGEILDGYNNDGDIETALTSIPDANRFNMFWYQAHNTIKWLVGYVEELFSAKFDKTGGIITGNISMGSRKITTSYIPVDGVDLTNKEYVDKAIAGGMWLGEIKQLAYPRIPTLPAGVEILPCDGRALSRTTYSSLFSLIGTTFGAGNGSTTFNIPDYRGVVIRGWDGGSGRDAGRAFGTIQQGGVPQHSHELSGTTSDQSNSHTHDRGTMNITGNFPLNSEQGYLGGAFYRSTTGNKVGFGGYAQTGCGFDASRSWTGNTSGASQGHTHTLTGTTTTVSNPQYQNINEVRMINANAYFYIRVK